MTRFPGWWHGLTLTLLPFAKNWCHCAAAVGSQCRVVRVVAQGFVAHVHPPSAPSHRPISNLGDKSIPSAERFKGSARRALAANFGSQCHQK